MDQPPPPPPPPAPWQPGSSTEIPAPYFGSPEPAPPRSRAGLFIAIVAVVTVVAIVAIAIGVVVASQAALKRRAPAGPLSASAAVTANRGTVVFSDDFHDSSSGWTTETLPSGTTFAYTSGGYVVVARGNLDHFATSPYDKPVQQVSISVTATQSDDAPTGAGYGVSCWRGQDAAELRYDFIVTSGGDWQVSRRDGGVPTKPLVLKQGTSTTKLGSTALAVEGMCATLADKQTTRLVLFAGAQKVADFTDTSPKLTDEGWVTDLMVTSATIHSSTVTASRFEVRDLSR